MPNYKNLIEDLEEGILIISINRPEKMNALNDTTLAELKISIENAYDNDEVRGLIITGVGKKAFVAGADISEFTELNELNGRKFSERGQEIFALVENCLKPVIAVVNGYALGGGCELALSCHLRLASSNAKLGLPEASLGILPAFGGTQRLTRLIGKGLALEIMLTGDMISAQRALEIGLVNQIVDHPSELIPACNKVLNKILKNAPLSAGKIITATIAAYSKDSHQVETHCFVDLIKTDDFTEGTKAFIEKRTPKFIGS